MNKKTLLLASILPLLAACGSDGGVIDPIPYVEPEPESRTDIVYLGFSDVRSYTPSDSVDFTVTVDDASIVTYSNVDKAFTSFTKAGTTLVHFASPKLNVEVTVTVQDDGTAPLFALDETGIELDNGQSYDVYASLSFRGVDAFASSSGLHFSKAADQDGDNTTLSIEGKKITVTATSLGSDVYTIYTEYAGLMLSKTLTVDVIDNQAFVVIGERMGFDSDGGVYKLSTYQYDSNRLNLRNDLSVSKGSSPVAYGDLTIQADSSGVISLVGDEILINKTGTASLTVSFGGESKTIKVVVYKPVIERKEISLAAPKFNLNLGLEVDAGSKVRSYAGDKSVTKSFEIETGTHSFVGVDSVEVNGIVRKNAEDAPLTYSSKVVTLTSASFDIDCAGEKDVVLTMEASDYLVEYSFKMLFVTKELLNKADCDNYLSMRFLDDAVFGYYTLGGDIDYMNYSPSQTWVSDAAKSFVGFRGTLDGAKPDGTGNYKIKNMKSTIYGLTMTIGEGGTFKNIDFYNSTLMSANKTSLLASFVFGGIFSNINVTLSDNSDVSTNGPETGDGKDPCASGVLSCQKIQDSYFENFTIDAKKHVIRSLCGKTATNNTFVDMVINCVDIVYYSTGTNFDYTTHEPTNGVRFSEKEIPGITINKFPQ